MLMSNILYYIVKIKHFTEYIKKSHLKISITLFTLYIINFIITTIIHTYNIDIMVLYIFILFIKSIKKKNKRKCTVFFLNKSGIPLLHLRIR